MCWRNCSLKLSAYFSTIFLISLSLCSGIPGCPPRCYQHRGTSLLGQFHTRLQPVFGLVAAADDVDVHPFFLVGIYLERVFAFASEYWTHNLLLLAAKIVQIKRSTKKNSHFIFLKSLFSELKDSLRKLKSLLMVCWLKSVKKQPRTVVSRPLLRTFALSTKTKTKTITPAIVIGIRDVANQPHV